MASGTIRNRTFVVKGTETTKTVPTGWSGQDAAVPDGYTLNTNCWLISAYPRTSADIAVQGVVSNTGTVRLINNSGSAWTGIISAYWLCVD